MGVGGQGMSARGIGSIIKSDENVPYLYCSGDYTHMYIC